MEARVGKRGLERTSRCVAITPKEETLLSYARRLLALNEEALRRLVAPPVSGHLRLGVADHFVPRNLAPLLARFSRSHPGIRLEVEVGRSHELRRAMEADALDLVLGKRRDGESEGTILWTEPVIWAATPGWTPPEGRLLPLAMLPAGCMFRDRALAALARAGLGFEVTYTSPSLLGVAAAAQAGLGVTVMGASGLPDGLVPLPGLPPLGTAEMAVFGDLAGLAPLAGPLVEAIRETVGGPAPLAA